MTVKLQALDKVAPGVYRTQRFNGRYYSCVRVKRHGAWVVQDHPDDGSPGWPDLVFTTLEEADRALARCPVERRNLMSGKTYYEAVCTPISCSPASETYWSM